MILALNTATRQSSVALLELNHTVVAEHLMPEGTGHFGHLMPAVDGLIKSAGINLKDIRCVSVATGPGSFTGLRVGLALAKGICQALRIPIIGISSLRALASQLPLSPDPIAPVLTSRRGEVFTALFRQNGETGLRRIEKDGCFKLDELPGLFVKQTVFIGNDYMTQGARLREMLGSRSRIAPPHYWQLRASSVGALACGRFQRGDWDEPGSLTPEYFRPPDIRSQPKILLNHK